MPVSDNDISGTFMVKDEKTNAYYKLEPLKETDVLDAADEVQVLNYMFGGLIGVIETTTDAIKVLGIVFRQAALDNAIQLRDRRKIKRAKRRLRKILREVKEEKNGRI